MLRRDVCEMDAHACSSCVAGSFRPDDTGVNFYYFRVAGQVNMYGGFSIDRQGAVGRNERSGGAYVCYAGIRVDAWTTGYDFQVG